MQTKESKTFSVSPGQLVYIKHFTFDMLGNIITGKEYAIIRKAFSCEWKKISNATFNNIEVIIKHDITARTRPFDIEFVEDMPKEEQNKIITKILLSI